MAIRLLLGITLLILPAYAVVGETEIIRAFARNDYETFERLYNALDDKSLYVTKDGTVVPFLFLTLHVEDPRFFEKALEEADPNAAGDWGMTPIHETVTLCNLERTQALIKKGADANHPPGDMNTPLHMATLMSCYDVAEYLLSIGANPAAKNNRGQTPADIARKLGDGKMRALLE